MEKIEELIEENHKETPMYLEVPRVNFPPVNQKKELLLSGGAGAISFQAGYMQGVS